MDLFIAILLIVIAYLLAKIHDLLRDMKHRLVKWDSEGIRPWRDPKLDDYRHN